jgi:hypothetical protein
MVNRQAMHALVGSGMIGCFNMVRRLSCNQLCLYYGLMQKKWLVLQPRQVYSQGPHHGSRALIMSDGVLA